MASIIKRRKVYYLQYYVGGKLKRRSLETDSLKLAKVKVKQFEADRSQGQDCPLPTKTSVDQIVSEYVGYVRLVKTPKSARTDIYYLRQIFGTICPALEITSRKVSVKAQRRPLKPDQDKRFKSCIEADFFEEITTADISSFIAAQVKSRGLAPKTANRYREILSRMFNWATKQGKIKMPGGKNPASTVERYKEHAPEIRFLTLAQIDEQLNALKETPQLQAMVAMYIYAGLRREELLWLQVDDIDLNAAKHGMIRIRAKTVNDEYWQPKTKKNRAVPISSALRYYLDQYNPHLSIGGWYFPSPKGKRYEPDNFSQELRETNKSVALPWGCFNYRHTFGSQLAMKGESLYKISTLMGNSPEICRRHYAAIIPETMADNVEFGQYHELKQGGSSFKPKLVGT